MFKTVLVANRGEIARRVLRACRALGVRGVAVYSEADAGWPHVKDADEAILIGPAPARESYLNAERIVEAARATGAEAIHPGYGFLSENYAGTMEFLVDRPGGFYFLEMNTRLQVEHPVTEEVTGLDLVQAQLRVSAGESLPWRQGEILQRAAAIECPICAEDPARNFMPSPGTITALRLPAGDGIRVECGVAPGLAVSVHYDPLLGKLIACGRDRAESLERMRRALAEFGIEGVKTTLAFHRALLSSERFALGQVHTQLVEQGAFHA